MSDIGEIDLMMVKDRRIIEGNDTDGDSFAVEAKQECKLGEDSLSQFVALTVVSSFTEHNLHYNNTVPTIITLYLC